LPLRRLRLLAERSQRKPRSARLAAATTANAESSARPILDSSCGGLRVRLGRGVPSAGCCMLTGGLTEKSVRDVVADTSHTALFFSAAHHVFCRPEKGGKRRASSAVQAAPQLRDASPPRATRRPQGACSR
jgi:hypothetical protein